jgi:cell wall assembly regulator SMI1
MMSIIKTFNTLGGFASHKPASENDIAYAEKQLKLKFSEEYCEYLRAFGQADGNGSEFTGITDIDYLNVVSETKVCREFCTQASDNLYVIENTNIDGVIVWQDSSGIVYKTLPGKAPQKIANSFAEYVQTMT